MPNPLFDITDGSTYVSLIGRESRGLHIKEWQPAINTIKGGGVFADNPIANSRQLVMRKWENAIETITLQVSSDDQDGVAFQLQSMFDMLEKATEYWTSEDQGEPVYLRVRGSTETNTRYALIHAYQLNALNNPFATPLFACNPSTIDGAVLTIERGHWMSVPPGDGDCVQISAGMSEAFPLTHYNYPNASSDDGTVDQDSATINTSNTYLRIGRDTSGNRNHAVMRFVTINIPPGSTITSAWITFEASNTQKPCSGSGQTLGTSCCYARFYGEDTDDAATFSTYGDWAARTWTTAYKNWTIPGTFQSKLYNSPDIATIIQEIIDRPGWAEGNDIGIFLVCLDHTPTGVFRRFASYDHTSYDRPQLTIRYITETGQEETCDFYTAFVANKQTTNNLTHIYLDDGGVFGANLLNAALPHQILPAVPAPNDAIYFGVQNGVVNQDSSTFNSLIFDIGTENLTETVEWEYWNGATWTALTVYDTSVVPIDFVFGETGVQSVFWKIPYNWAVTTVNAVTGWWVRARVMGGAGTGPGPTQQNRHIYTVSWPNASIAADQIDGDIPALARVEVSAVAEDDSGSWFDVHRVLLASRATDRGSGFTPFINLTDVQTIGGVNVSVVGGTTTFVDYPQAATGRCVAFSPVAAAADAPRVYIVFESADNTYKGRYRVFLRTSEDGSNTTGAMVSLSYYSSTVGTALITTKQQAVFSATNLGAVLWQLLDFGLVDIPIGKQYFANGDGQNKTMIAINVQARSSGTMYMHDLILFPCDEWYGDFVIPALENIEDSGLGSFGQTLAADSLFLPRKQLRAASGWMAVGEKRWEFLSEVWRASTVGEVVLPPRTAQNIYTLSAWWLDDEYWLSTPENGFAIRVHKAERWLGMRGSS